MQPTRPREPQTGTTPEPYFRPYDQVPIYDQSYLSQMNMHDTAGQASLPPAPYFRSQPATNPEAALSQTVPGYLMYVQYPGYQTQPYVPIQPFPQPVLYYPQPLPIQFGQGLSGPASPWPVTFSALPAGNAYQLQQPPNVPQTNPLPASALSEQRNQTTAVETRPTAFLTCPNCHHHFVQTPAPASQRPGPTRTDQGVQTSPFKETRNTADDRRSDKSGSEGNRLVRHLKSPKPNLPSLDQKSYLQRLFQRRLFPRLTPESKKRISKPYVPLTALIRSFWNERYVSPPMTFVYVSKKYYDRIEAWEMTVKYELTHERISSNNHPPWLPVNEVVSAEGRQRSPEEDPV